MTLSVLERESRSKLVSALADGKQDELTQEDRIIEASEGIRRNRIELILEDTLVESFKEKTNMVPDEELTRQMAKDRCFQRPCCGDAV